MAEAETPLGVLAMAYGSPASVEDVERYYTHVRGGRPPSPELLSELQGRYAAIGGTSPLVERSRALVESLRRALGPGFLVELGFKHAEPYVEDAAAMLVEAGAARVAGLVLAPHSSQLSSDQYHQRAAIALRGAEYLPVAGWHVHPVLIELLAERLMEALGRFPAAGRRVETIFTAHSLPVRAIGLDHPSYPDQLWHTAEAVAAHAGVEPGRWRVAWQSAGRTSEPWIGPDILEVVRELGREGIDGAVVCPAGFVSDHLEVLYDIDIEARRVAEGAGLRLERTSSLNDDPRFSAMLAGLVQATFAPSLASGTPNGSDSIPFRVQEGSK